MVWSRIENATLNTILPNPSGKKVNLSWTNVGAPSCLIYREQIPITSVSGLSPIAKTSSINYMDFVSITGTYYYAIVGTDGYTKSMISNCESLFVDATPPTWSDLIAPDVKVDSEAQISISVDDNLGIQDVFLFVDAVDFPEYPYNASMLSSDGITYRYSFTPRITGTQEFKIYIEDTLGNYIFVNGSFNVSESEATPEDNFIFIIIISIIAAGVATAGIITRQQIKKKFKEKEELIASLKQQREELTEDEINIYKEKYICLVHKGPTEGMTFICPHCKSYYCLKCYEAITKVENECWSCNNPLDPSKKVKKYIKKGKIEFIREEEARKHKLKDIK